MSTLLPRLFKILYIDPNADEKSSSAMLERITADLPFTCAFTVVPNAFTGLECTEHTQYGLILVTNAMADLSGLEFLRILDNVGCVTPVVLLLAQDEVFVTKEIAARFRPFLETMRTPFSVPNLCETIVAAAKRFILASSSSSSSSSSTAAAAGTQDVSANNHTNAHYAMGIACNADSLRAVHAAPPSHTHAFAAQPVHPQMHTHAHTLTQTQGQGSVPSQHHTQHVQHQQQHMAVRQDSGPAHSLARSLVPPSPHHCPQAHTPTHNYAHNASYPHQQNTSSSFFNAAPHSNDSHTHSLATHPHVPTLHLPRENPNHLHTQTHIVTPRTETLTETHTQQAHSQQVHTVSPQVAQLLRLKQCINIYQGEVVQRFLESTQQQQHQQHHQQQQSARPHNAHPQTQGSMHAVPASFSAYSAAISPYLSLSTHNEPAVAVNNTLSSGCKRNSSSIEE